jgi:hypothetical protein
MKARNRPPRLVAHPGLVTPAPPPSVEQRLVQAKVAGRLGSPGPSELRHAVDQLEAGEPEAWAAILRVFGASPEHPQIDPACTVQATSIAAARIGKVARDGGRIAFATAHPGSLLGVHTALARFARRAGAQVEDFDDDGPFRADGRTPRWLRWIEGVAMVTDGASLLTTQGIEAADEWMFLIGRPTMVVVDGAFAAAALGAGVEAVAFAGLDRIALAMTAPRSTACTVVPVHVGRPPRAYAPIVELFEASLSPGRGE